VSHFNEHQLQQIRNTIHDLDAMKEAAERRRKTLSPADLTHWRQTGEWPAWITTRTFYPTLEEQAKAIEEEGDR
jgi:hypothetical protein